MHWYQRNAGCGRSVRQRTAACSGTALQRRPCDRHGLQRGQLAYLEGLRALPSSIFDDGRALTAVYRTGLSARNSRNRASVVSVRVLISKISAS